jgi:hypothetical protein
MSSQDDFTQDDKQYWQHDILHSPLQILNLQLQIVQLSTQTLNIIAIHDLRTAI